VATILHIEDNDAMALVFRAAIEEARLHATVYRVPTGEEALAYLRGEGRHAGRTWPDIVYLDLNMPRVDGFQVLQDLAADPSAETMKVVVSTSALIDQRDNARLGRADFVLSKDQLSRDTVAALLREPRA